MATMQEILSQHIKFSAVDTAVLVDPDAPKRIFDEHSKGTYTAPANPVSEPVAASVAASVADLVQEEVPVIPSENKAAPQNACGALINQHMAKGETLEQMTVAFMQAARSIYAGTPDMANGFTQFIEEQKGILPLKEVVGNFMQEMQKVKVATEAQSEKVARPVTSFAPTANGTAPTSVEPVVQGTTQTPQPGR